MAVARLNFFPPAPGQRAALREMLTAVIGQVAAAPGCIAVTLMSSQSDPGQLVIYELWRSLDDHAAAAAVIPPEMVTQAMALMSGPAEGYFLDVLAEAAGLAPSPQ